MANWLKGCEVCNAGLCARFDELIESGKSQRQAAQLLEDEQKEKLDYIIYPAETLRTKYNRNKPAKKVVSNDTKLHGTDEEKELNRLRTKLKRITNSLRQVNPNKDSLRLGGSLRIKLNGAKRGFYRKVDEYPGEGTERELLLWETYFELGNIKMVVDVIQDWFREQIPEELPENRSKPKTNK